MTLIYIIINGIGRHQRPIYFNAELMFCSECIWIIPGTEIEE